ncbi:flagellin [Sporolactobacillus sp. Y61]|uniref:Flagellin n=1 Tax=Sporolactobacillus sp. Y61 TaxID=3160863 RepID=A0AAU8IBR7_9BACL
MIINHNIAALNTLNNLSKNTAATQKSLEKLSSGLRINRAGDDAAGLAISEKMRGQIRGLDMANKNAQDGVSLIQTAEGALSETHSILQRMRELAVQSANDTNTTDDRSEIQKEIEQLKSEINRISSDTEFNTKKLISGGIGATSSIGTTNTAGLSGVAVETPSLDTGAYTFTITVDNAAAVSGQTDAGTGVTAVTSSAAGDHTLGNYQLNVTDDSANAGKKLLTLVNRDTGKTVGTLNNQADDTTSYTIAGYEFTNGGTISNGSYSFTEDADISVAVTDGATTVATATVDNLTKGEFEVAGVNLQFNSNVAAGATDVNVVNNSIQFHIGANEDQTMDLAVNDMSATALGVDTVDVTSATGAESAITSLDDAIKSVSSERSKLGAFQNRLEHTINNLGTSSENLTAAESRIRDVDMAKEMSNFTKNNILNQAAQAMLAQSNQLPQGVLQLLR